MFCLHRNHFIAGLALCALGNICTAEMARDVAPEVAALLHSKNSYVRKKAALCSVRIVKKVPDLADEFVDGAGELLSDRHHGVLLCAVTLALELCGVDESHVVHFRKHVSVLVKILMSLIRAGYSAEHDVGGEFLLILVVWAIRMTSCFVYRPRGSVSPGEAAAATRQAGRRGRGRERRHVGRPRQRGVQHRRRQKRG